MCLVALVFSAGQALAAPGDTNAQAVQKGVNFLVPDVVQFTDQNQCIACHRQGAALYGLALAKGAGFNVNMDLTVGAPHIAQAIANDQQPSGYWDWGGPNRLKSSYNFYGLAGYDAYVSTAYSNKLVAAADFAVGFQESDGRWYDDFDDGETAHGDITYTARYIVGIAQAKQRVDANKAAAYQASMDKAAAYIVAHQNDASDWTGTPYSYEVAWAIIGLKAAGLPDNDPNVQAFVTKLQAQKSSLGYAWGLQAGNGPDLFNSGMAIYALCKAGVSAIGNQALTQSLGWVNNQQGWDGSWGSDIYTTFAVLGLSCYGDYGVIVTNSGVTSRVISSNSPNPQTVTYTFDIQNHGFIDDTYNLSVVGGMPGWTSSIATPVAIAAGAHQTVTLTVNAPPHLPEALPVEMTVLATSQAVPSLSASARITTFTDPPPPVTGDSTAVTLTAGNGASIALSQTIQLKATVKDTTTNTGIVGPGKGVVTFFVAGLAVATDTDADGDGVYSVNFTPNCDWTALGAQDFRAIYSGIDLPAGQTDLLSSLYAGTLTITAPACCARPEVCDGKDNDCDGVVDNGLNVGAACSVGVGECAAAGVLQCNGQGGVSCSAVAGAPTAEVCDGLDNDCDGVADNGNPGSGVSCTSAFPGACSAGTTTCSSGAIACVPSILPGAHAETCNGVDDDCDGAIDNGFNLGASCSNGLGACAATGTIVCAANGTATCNAVPGAPSTEVCGDDVDQDCDGNTNNGCACLDDSACGGATSGQICDTGVGSSYKCVLGCRQSGGNGCGAGLKCTSEGSVAGTCVVCLADADCGGENSGQICDATSHACKLGCRGSDGNGCTGNLVCTSTDSTAGTCVGCVTDSNCGDAKSGIVCDTVAHQCKLGCRGSDGNGCSGNLVCTSSDSTIGSCTACLTDANCGDAKSGVICDPVAQKCMVGCRGGNADGNGCSGSLVCTSSDATPGKCAGCVSDSDCGGAKSGIICDAGTNTCVSGCRGGEGAGNGCAGTMVCTSKDASVGLCIECLADSDCGAADSGRVCDQQVCVSGCRGSNGNGCGVNQVCSSDSNALGTCGAVDPSTSSSTSGSSTSSSSTSTSTSSSGAGGSAASSSSSSATTGAGGGHESWAAMPGGGGFSCSTQPSNDKGGMAWLFGSALAALVSWRRRRAA